MIRSDSCVLGDLLTPYAGFAESESKLGTDDGWPRRWTVTWRVGEGKVTWPVRDMASVPVLSSRMIRGFTWRADQGHRPGLQFMVSTGRHHGFESLEEQQLLLALDYFGVAEVLPQPFRLDFDSSEGKRWHIPDFLAVMPDGGLWLFDVRPEGLIGNLDAVKFAAAARSAAACGWRYSVAAGWRPHVRSVLDHLSSQRRLLVDQLGLQRELEDAAARGADRFGDLVEATRLPAVARAHATHLLWWRRLGVDLGSPLVDGSLIWRGRTSAGGA